MQLIEAYKKFWLNYANFSGRTRRSDYWFYVLANLIISFALNILLRLSQYSIVGTLIISFFSSLYYLSIIVPSIAICIRRLHDIGKSGAYFLFFLIPLVGQIMLIVWYATDSQPGVNQYGVSEKYPNAVPYQQPYNQQAPNNTQPNWTYSDHPNYCKHCGNKVKFNEKFCPKCGTKLK